MDLEPLEVLDLVDLQRKAQNPLGLRRGEHIRATVHVSGYKSTGRVTVTNEQGIFYQLDSNPNSYGWARPAFGDLVERTGEGVADLRYNLTEPEEGEMAELEDLQRSISEMSDEELYAIIQGDRANRRAVPEKKRNAAVKKKADKSPSVGVEALFASLSPEQKAEFIRQLESGS